MAITGQVAAAGFYQLTLVIISVAQFIFLRVLVPMIKVYVCLLYTSYINNFFSEIYASGEMKTIADTYKVSDTLVEPVSYTHLIY